MGECLARINNVLDLCYEHGRKPVAIHLNKFAWRGFLEEASPESKLQHAAYQVCYQGIPVIDDGAAEDYIAVELEHIDLSAN